MVADKCWIVEFGLGNHGASRENNNDCKELRKQSAMAMEAITVITEGHGDKTVE